MQQVKNCNNCKHFHADPEQEGVFGDCRKNAPITMPQAIADSQPGYSRVIYMGTWPAVFGDHVCSEFWPFSLRVDELMRPAEDVGDIVARVFASYITRSMTSTDELKLSNQGGK
jgi:hypothetical protein